MEEYFVFYQNIRDNIYDFRIKDNHKINNYKNLNIFNLAIILATRLEIKYFSGVDENQQLRFFNFINSRERFTILDLQDIQSNPYIVIYNKTSNNIYIKIMNSKWKNLELKLIIDCENYYDAFKITDYNINDTTFYNTGGLNIINCLMDKFIYSYKPITKGRKTKLSKIKLDIEFNINQLPYFGLLYLNNDKKILLNIEITHDEFKSLLFNCLQTPLITNKELNIGETIIWENDDKYIDMSGKYAIAIDPSIDSRDKDDAIRFEEIDDYNGKKVMKMYVYISDVSPYINLYNPYLFNYCLYKQETEYIGETLKYALVDPYLSENRLSLMGNNKNAIEIMVVYEKIDQGKIYNIPLEVNVQRVKNINILYTTYTDIHNNIINENRNDDLIYDYPNTRRVLFNNFSLKNDQQINITEIFKGQNTTILNNSLIKQFKLFHKYYSILNKCLVITDNIQPIYPEVYYQENNILNNNLYDDIYERWIHKLIEITALESNKYLALIQYKFVSEGNLSGNYNITCHDIKLLHQQLKRYHEEEKHKIFELECKSRDDEGKLKVKYNTDKLVLICEKDEINRTTNVDKQKFKTSLEYGLKLEALDKKYENDVNIIKEKLEADKLKIHEKRLQHEKDVFLGFYKISKSFNSDLNCELNPKNIVDNRYDVISECFIKKPFEIIRHKYNKYETYSKNDSENDSIYSSFPKLLLSSNTFFSTQFTSPLRRFLDLLVHNLLFIQCDQTVLKVVFKIFKIREKNFNDNIKIYNRYFSLFNYLSSLNIDYKTLVLYTINKNTILNKKEEEAIIYYPSFYCFFIDYIYTEKQEEQYDNSLIELSNIKFINPFQINCKNEIIINDINKTLTKFIFDRFLSTENNYLKCIIKWLIGDNTIQIFDPEIYYQYIKINYKPIEHIYWKDGNEIIYFFPRSDIYKYLFVVNIINKTVVYFTIDENTIHYYNKNKLTYNGKDYEKATGAQNNDNVFLSYNRLYLYYSDSNCKILVELSKKDVPLMKNPKIYCNNLNYPKQFDNCSTPDHNKKYLKYKIKYLNLKKSLDM